MKRSALALGLFLSGNGGASSDPAAAPAAVIPGSARLPLVFLMGSFQDHCLFTISREQERVRLRVRMLFLLFHPAELVGFGGIPTSPSAEVSMYVEIGQTEQLLPDNTCLAEAYIGIYRETSCFNLLHTWQTCTPSITADKSGRRSVQSV